MLNFLPGARYMSLYVRLIFGEEMGHPKIGNFWDPLVIKEYVTGLDVPVNDTVVRVLMQVQQPPGNAIDYVQPPFPVKLPLLIRLCSKLYQSTS